MSKRLTVLFILFLSFTLSGCVTYDSGPSILKPVAVTEKTGCSLCYPAYKGDLATVAFLLSRGSNPNAHEKGDTPLLWALQKKHWNVALLLLHYHANPNFVFTNQEGLKFSSLCYAIDNNQDVSLEALIKAGANVNSTCGYVNELEHAVAETRNPRIIEDLLAAGAHPKKSVALSPSSFSALGWVIKPELGTIPVKYSLREVKDLLAAGADPNFALYALADYGNLNALPGEKRILKLLLAYGAKPWRVKDNLLLGQIHGSRDLADLLINAGDYVDMVGDDGQTALDMCFTNRINNHLDMNQLELLLSLGADPNIGSNKIYGVYPIINAAISGNTMAVKYLLYYGATLPFNYNIYYQKYNPKIRRIFHHYTLSDNQFGHVMLEEEITNHNNPIPASLFLKLLSFYWHNTGNSFQRTDIFWYGVLSMKNTLNAPPEAVKAAKRGYALFMKAHNTRSEIMQAANDYDLAVRMAPWVGAYQRNLCLLYYGGGAYYKAWSSCSLYREVFRNDADVNNVYSIIKNKFGNTINGIYLHNLYAE